jgi:hypothetical protein
MSDTTFTDILIAHGLIKSVEFVSKKEETTGDMNKLELDETLTKQSIADKRYSGDD